ncbi:uncharacterized protein LOC134272045 [Saccostrea cucullata]|uniref:uncharacterized protein LOC134272045 n=1 Tax=Saccostrea cuccullata TaxID=36930 RepID=UPI002ED3201B
MPEDKPSPSEVVKALKCGVCWSYFNKPHTLKCGHSFCLRCLYKLCRVARENSDHVMLSLLKFPCPTCRSPMRVRYILQRHACVNYAIQEYVNHWKKERNHVREMHQLKVRSVGCQNSFNEEQDVTLDWDNEHSPVSAVEYNHVTTRLDVSSFLSDVATSVSSVSCAEVSEVESEFTVDTSTEDSEDFDFHIGNRDGRGRFRGQGARMAVVNFFEDIAFTFRDMFRSPNRSIMALIWCGYTFSIMLIANGFFPYMILYSLLFILILYAETVQQRRR